MRDLPKNRFKAAISRGEVQVGLWNSLVSAVAAEIVSQSGYDWLLFDSEHSPVEIAGLLPLLHAVAAGNSHAAVRVAWNDPVLIKRALDLGAQTLFVPFVETADEASRAVSAATYPPDGIRGVSGASRATGYGRVAGYAAKAGQEICLIVQVETRGAVQRIEEIAAVPGVDGVFIGPSDLSAAMGHPGQPDHPEIQGAIRDAGSRIAATGKPAGILARNSDEARRYIGWGFTFVAAGLDSVLLARAADVLAQAVKEG